MTITTDTRDSIKESSLSVFDDVTHIAIGTGTTTPLPADTVLGSEVERNAFDEVKVKNSSSGTYDFTSTFGLTEANGSTLAETGLFTASSGGTMRLRKLLTNTIAKTSSVEVSVGLRVTVTVTNT